MESKSTEPERSSEAVRMDEKIHGFVMDMTPQTRMERLEQLLREAEKKKLQPVHDFKIVKLPRTESDKLVIANMLKCTFCKLFPHPNEYYFCSNKKFAHILCKNCFENFPSICTAEIPIIAEDQDRMNLNANVSAGLSKSSKKWCGMPFYPAKNPLYDLMLTDSTFYCIHKQFCCKWTGPAKAFQEHVANCKCNLFIRDKVQCPFTNCEKSAVSDAKLLKHLEKIHQAIVIKKTDLITSLQLNWEENNSENCVWVPAIIKCPDKELDILLTIEFENGKLYEWLYVIGSEEKVSEVYILSGFRDKMDTTRLHVETPEFLNISAAGIKRKKSFFSINISDFVENHVKRNENKECSFIFDVNIM